MIPGIQAGVHSTGLDPSVLFAMLAGAAAPAVSIRWLHHPSDCLRRPRLFMDLVVGEIFVEL
jgi:hypothetical protein